MTHSDSCDVEIFVIIPAYNCEKYITDSVDSVLRQPYAKIHSVIIDDGSTDSTPKICDELRELDARVHVIHQKNGGVSAARNAGIDYVLSEYSDRLKTCYIAFLDADDQWAANFFSEDILRQFKEGYQMLCYQSCICNADLTKRKVPTPLAEGVYPGGNQAVWLHSSQSFAAVFHSCELLNRYALRFPLGVKYNEDKIFNMHCLYLADSIRLENKLLYYYRQIHSSAMHSRPHGISYYVPIIEAWLASDSSMRRWSNNARGQLSQGSVLASIYLMDMIEEHFMRFGSMRVMKQFFVDHPEHVSLLANVTTSGNDHSRRAYEEMMQKKNRFLLRCYVSGIKRSISRGFLRNTGIRRAFEKHKYTVDIDR